MIKQGNLGKAVYDLVGSTIISVVFQPILVTLKLETLERIRKEIILPKSGNRFLTLSSLSFRDLIIQSFLKFLPYISYQALTICPRYPRILQVCIPL